MGDEIRYPAAAPAPAPVPIPVAVPDRSRRPWWPWTLLIAVLLVGCCGISYVVGEWLIEDGFGEFLDPLAGGWLPGDPYAAWCGDGRFAVAQAYGEEGEPLVVAYDTETDETLKLPGHTLRAVEVTAAIVWAEPWREGDQLLWGLGPGGPADAPVEALTIWKLDSDTVMPGQALRSWEPWKGAAGVAALLWVDTSVGAAPSALTFRSGDGSMKVEAMVPDDVHTFIGIGWSPSGRYFAVETLSSVDESTGGVFASGGPDPAQAGSERRALIFDSADGAVAAEAELGEWTGAPSAAWLPDSDALVWVHQSPMTDSFEFEPAPVNVRIIEPGDKSKAYFRPAGMRPPRDDDSLEYASLMGAGPDGVLIYADGRGWRLTSQEVEDIGVVVSGAWHPRSGVVWYEYDWGPGFAEAATVRFYVGGVRGEGETRIWQYREPMQAGWD